jgi:signal transduction histidine kinase
MLLSVTRRDRLEEPRGLMLPVVDPPAPWAAVVALRERDDAIRAILLASSHPIVVLHAVRGPLGELVDFEQILVNPPAVTLVGARVGVRLSTQDSLLSSEDLVTMYARVVTHGRPVTLEVCLERDHTRKWLQINAVKLGDGAAVGFTDITEHKRTELEAVRLTDELRQREMMEMVGRLAAGIAHDVNNLLHATYGYTGAAESRLEPSHPAREDLRHAMVAARAASGLIQRLTAIRQETTFTPVDVRLNGLIEDFADVLGCLLGGRTTLELNLRAERDSVRGIPGELEQVLLNLCLNSRHAMPKGGTVTIATADVGGRRRATGRDPDELRQVLLIVSDNGTGMSDEVRNRIFQPFFTTHAARGGTGFGLPTVKTIVERHGGTIEVESAPGQGTRIGIFLPSPRVAG